MRRLLAQAELIDLPRRLTTRADAELREHRRDVMVDRLRGDVEASGDLVVREVLGEAQRDFDLATLSDPSDWSW